MLTITPRLGSLDAKARLNTRTAKDGEEYSQLIFEVNDQEIGDAEVNLLFSTPHAFAAFKALQRAVKGIKEIETDFKIEGAAVYVRLGAVSAANGAEFTFEKCVVDHMRIGHLESDEVKLAYRVTCKPALDAKFGELVSRFGHTAMIGLNAEMPNAQEQLPLGKPDILPEQTNGEAQAAALENSRAIGTPEENRADAHERERAIAAQLSEGRTHAADAAAGDGKSTAELIAGTKPKRKRASAHATH